MSSHYGTPPRSPRNEGAAVDVSMRLMSILTPPRLTRSTSASAGGARQDAEIVFVGDNNNDELHDEESLSSVEPSEANECCICLEEMGAIDIASIDGCNHQFCTSCVMHWSETSNTCPICRARFRSYESAEGVVRVPDRLPAVAGVFDLEEVTLERVRVLYQDETETLEQRRLNLERATERREDIRHLAEDAADTYGDLLRYARFIASQPPSELLAEVQFDMERVRQLMEGNRQCMVDIEQLIEEIEPQIEQSEQRVAILEQIIANLAEE